MVSTQDHCLRPLSGRWRKVLGQTSHTPTPSWGLWAHRLQRPSCEGWRHVGLTPCLSQRENTTASDDGLHVTTDEVCPAGADVRLREAREREDSGRPTDQSAKLCGPTAAGQEMAPVRRKPQRPGLGMNLVLLRCVTLGRPPNLSEPQLLHPQKKMLIVSAWSWRPDESVAHVSRNESGFLFRPALHGNAPKRQEANAHPEKQCGPLLSVT